MDILEELEQYKKYGTGFGTIKNRVFDIITNQDATEAYKWSQFDEEVQIEILNGLILKEEQTI